MLTNIESQSDYDEYKSRVEHFFNQEGINCLSVSEKFQNCEPFFSWSNCDCCCRPLGGDRYEASGYNPSNNEVYTYIVCMDCLYFAEYGQLDDMTMLDFDLE